MKTKMTKSWLAVVWFLSLGLQIQPAQGADAQAENVQPATAGLVDGDPALQWSSNDWSTYISFAEYKGETAFKFPASHQKPRDNGIVYITASHVLWMPAPGSHQDDQPFEVNSSDVITAPKGLGCNFKIAGKWVYFLPLYQHGQEVFDPANVPKGNLNIGASFGFAEWCSRAATDFQGAQRRFHAAVGDAIWANSPEVKAQRQTEQQAFQQQLSAWRAAGSKVDPSEEAQRHFAIAQEAFKEKNFQHQAEELSAALGIYPTWPAEQSDLAVILGELGRYSEAIEHMQMYLELVPDAPDAQKAKQQIWIWQDKVKASIP